MLIPPTTAKMRHSLTLLEQWRNETRQMLIDSLDTDAYAIPDALITLNQAHEQAKGIIARYLYEEYQTAAALSQPNDDSEGDDTTATPVA